MIGARDVDEGHLGIIRGGGRELDSTDTYEPGEPVFSHVNAADILHTNLVAAFNYQAGLDLHLAISYDVELAGTTDGNIEQDENPEGARNKEQWIALPVIIKPETERAAGQEQEGQQPAPKKIPMRRAA